jgi:antibiotic biosynthesis monooxygenase (ABM) superfamily enzyme
VKTARLAQRLHHVENKKISISRSINTRPEQSTNFAAKSRRAATIASDFQGHLNQGNQIEGKRKRRELQKGFDTTYSSSTSTSCRRGASLPDEQQDIRLHRTVNRPASGSLKPFSDNGLRPPGPPQQPSRQIDNYRNIVGPINLSTQNVVCS